MKNLTIKTRLKKMLIASLLWLVLYFCFYPLTGALVNTSDWRFIAYVCVYVVLMALYPLLLIYLTYIRSGLGEDMIFDDYPDSYKGFMYDLKLVIKQEKLTAALVGGINFICWIISAVDISVFSRRTVSLVTVVALPLNVISEVLPSAAFNVLGYAAGSIIFTVFYIIELVLLRKKWYTANKV